MKRDKSAKISGTSFKQKVLKVVSKIPAGKILTYKEVAKATGNKFAWRAVGNILNKNDNPKIPCHRVVKSDGRAGGYNKGFSRKIHLLIKEGVVIKNSRIVR